MLDSDLVMAGFRTEVALFTCIYCLAAHIDIIVAVAQATVATPALKETILRAGSIKSRSERRYSRQSHRSHQPYCRFDPIRSLQLIR